MNTLANAALQDPHQSETVVVVAALALVAQALMVGLAVVVAMMVVVGAVVMVMMVLVVGGQTHLDRQYHEQMCGNWV